jgi:hypothetical protein
MHVERRAQLLNHRGREFHFRLDPGRAGDPKLGTGLGGIIEQGGLADARFAVHHQHAAAALAHALQQPVEQLAFALPAEQPPA